MKRLLGFDLPGPCFQLADRQDYRTKELRPRPPRCVWLRRILLLPL